jgi:hypothetical protein
VCGSVQRRKALGRAGWNACSIMRKLAVQLARRKAPWVVPPSSRHGEMAPRKRGDGGTTLALAVKPTLYAREACGAAAGGRNRSRRAGAAERQRVSEVESFSVKALPAPA